MYSTFCVFVVLYDLYYFAGVNSPIIPSCYHGLLYNSLKKKKHVS